MLPSSGLIMECEDDELSEAQLNQHANAKKEHDKATQEANIVKKDGQSVIKLGNVWTVKSTYHVKIRNHQAPVSAQTLQKVVNPNTTGNQPIPNSLLKNLPSNSNIVRAVPSVSQSSLTKVVAPAVQILPEHPPMEMPPYPASQLLSHFTSNKPKQPQIVQLVQPLQLQQNVALAINKVQPNKPPVIKPVAAAPQPVPPTIKLPEIRTEPTAGQVQRKSTPAPPAAASAPDDQKNLSKSVPSLCVVVKPSKSIPDVMNQKKRETLDGFVKSRLVMDNRRFAEWLMQVGLLRSHQVGFCRAHNAQSLNPLQLRMYAEESRFPHSGGYVWITKCCDRNFVSIFRDSIFEDATQPPTVLLKLMYHWSCQTAISNVIQWVKVDHFYLRSFYTMMRSVCTVEVHTSTPIFGVSPKNNRVEVGVISLGTTSADGKRRDVKVEVLGLFDQDTQKIRLRASEPIVGDTRSRVRFAKILEPLTSWVSPKAVILTDFTVDKTALEELGFHHIIQKTLNSVSVDDKQSNRNIMDYLRKTVPKVFQNTLSVLSTATIQQFLDELVWRESHGLSAADAFHNIIRDLSAQARVDTGMSLIKRLPAVAADPFKDWSLKTAQIAVAAPVPIPASLTVTKTTTAPAPTATTTVLPKPIIPAPVVKVAPAPVPVPPPVQIPQPSMLSSAVKRPATSPLTNPPSNPKEIKYSPLSSYYATMQSARGTDTIVCIDTNNSETICQHNNCSQVVKTNLDMMVHLREHLTKELSISGNKKNSEQCTYCLLTFPSDALKKEHEETNHCFLQSFNVGDGQEDSCVVKEIVCLICHEKFSHYRLLDQHLQATHVSYEMPYRCRACSYQTSSHSQLIEHFHGGHSTNTHLLCPMCLETFSVAGDNVVKHMDTGHLQYLQHLKNHLGVPASARHRCKRCVLTFLQYEQLRLHLRTDHTSMIGNITARPFTFTIAKSQAPKQPSPAKALIAPSPSSPASSSSATSASSFSKTKTQAKEAKEVSMDIPNSQVAKRFTGLVVSSEFGPVHTCWECQDPLVIKGHFSGYLCCSSCKFSSCCKYAMKKHQDEAHRAVAPIFLGPVFDLSSKVTCPCGFITRSGLHLGKHVLKCNVKSFKVLHE